jgi:pyruvate,water dikinase
MVKYISSLQNIAQFNNQLIGTKGATLGKLIQLGINVPKGFIISSTAFADFLKKNQITQNYQNLFQSITITNLQTTAEKFAIIKQQILAAKFPEQLSAEILMAYQQLIIPLVAVRSSATCEDGDLSSWAGQFQSFLNVDETNLFLNIKKCWAAVFSSQTLFYYQHAVKQPAAHFAFAIVIQTMLQSDVAGIAFTHDSQDKDSDVMLIAAVYGLGESLTSGELKADSYRCQKSSEKILEKRIVKQEKKFCYNSQLKKNTFQEVAVNQQNAQKLNDSKIIELISVSKQLVAHFKKPLDIEWAVKNGQLFILQVRPITKL